MKRTRLAPSGLVRRYQRETNGRELSVALSAFGAEIRRGPCVMCSAFPPTPEERFEFGALIAVRQAHHALPAAALKRLANRFGWQLLVVLPDVRNGMCLCEFHHGRHTNYFVDGSGRSWRVPRSLVRDSTYDFAEELGIEWLLDYEYPPDDNYLSDFSLHR